VRKTIELEWPILPGSISTARSRCGKARCACKLRPPRLHGIYYRWTGFIGGKRTTKTVSKDVAQECRKRIRNFRKLQKDIDTLLRESIDKAPWTSHPKARGNT
jgi:hypothetical protein